jgi:lysophospholipase
MLHLVETPQNPVPPGAAVYVLNASDGVSLRMAHFKSQKPVVGTVALLQGRAEFIEKYFETIGQLLDRGFEVVTIDWRGQGGSARDLANPRKGHIDDFDQYQRDIAALVTRMTRLECPKPWFAVAHSMGGAVLLEYVHGGGDAFRRLAVSAPMLDVHGLRFPRGARWLANTLDMLGLGAMYIPGGGDASLVELPFEGNILTSDPLRLARNAAVLAKEPALAIGDPTIGWTNSAFRQMARFQQPDYTFNWRMPVLIFMSGQERLVSNVAIERFAQRLDLAQLVTIPGARHEVMMERDELRAQFFAAFDAFIPGGKVVKNGAERATN